ncbi:hypothetical protein AK830_g3883 [Neonectria ditissima]|uniref:Peptidase S9 prolyl oligopeptidase catalytic domain-containing protein n=1 Tax=Neonectria ditissima TaxID=78410 RepID=A0A0P7BPH4_9HYPO|nr:hypothetical protein AK830_g3883 [Neonectria ditissima]
MLFTKSLIALSAASAAAASASYDTGYPPNITILNETANMYQLSSDSEFNFILAEYLSLANEGGAATGEVLRAASRIQPGDFDSWYDEFNHLAEKIHAMGDASHKKGALVSARDAYFRSSSYWRAADFFLHGNLSDPRIYTLWDKQLADFDTAVGLLRRPATKLNLKADGFSIPAYFFPADSSLPGHASGKRVPTVIVGTGYDGSQQALYHGSCRAIIERGWNCITYEGPGQPTVRRDQNKGFIPEWWKVITPVVDYLHTRDDVDVDRISLIGLSFGGLLAPLAATREHRLAAVIAIDGMYSLQVALGEAFPSSLVQLYESGNKTAFDSVIYAALKAPSASSQLRWGVEQGMFAWNTTSPYEWFTGTGEFFLNPDKVKSIKAPVFVGSGQNDNLAPGQPEVVARWFGKQARYVLFETDVGAGEHCALGAEQQLARETLDWLAGEYAKV